MYDVRIVNGLICDGTGKKPYKANLGIKNGRVVEIGEAAAGARVEVDASDLVVSPGFVDSHQHADTRAFVDPAFGNCIAQGITTTTAGMCGISPFPDADNFADLTSNTPFYELNFYGSRLSEIPRWTSHTDYASSLRQRGIAVNLAAFVGHSSLRWKVGARTNEAVSEAQLSAMVELLREGLGQGARGITFGLSYPPSRFADMQEIVALARAAAGCRGVVQIHVPLIGSLQGVQLAVNICEASGAPVNVCHLNPPPSHLHEVPAILERIDQARGRGIDVTYSVIQEPLSAFRADGVAAVALWALGRAGTLGMDEAELRARAPDASFRRRLRQAVIENIGYIGDQYTELFTLLGKAELLLTGDPDLEGRAIPEIARRHGVDPAELAFDIALGMSDIVKTDVSPTFVIPFLASEETIAQLNAYEACMPCVDFIGNETDDDLLRSSPQPNGYTTFSKYFRTVVAGGMKLEEAIRHMTSLPAQSLGLTSRGVLAPGKCADIAVLAPDRFAPRATIAEPTLPPDGLAHAFVAGVPVLLDGQRTDARPGSVLGWDD